MKKFLIILLLGGIFLIALLTFILSRSQPEPDWLLWLDRDINWKQEEPQTPQEVGEQIKPSCGWENLFKKYSSNPSKVFNNKNLSLCVSTPATVEEYFWDEISGNKNGTETSGDYRGVSWWGKNFFVPKDDSEKIIKLNFESGVRQKAEIFVNQKYVGCQIAHQLPFEIDITNFVKFNQKNQIAIRITDPNGNFSWGDFMPEHWGKYIWQASHGFGGILGEVSIKTLPKIHVSDIFVKNTPSLFDIDTDIEITNLSNQSQTLYAEVEISENFLDSLKVENPRTIYKRNLGKIELSKQKHKSITVSSNVPDAKLWDIGKGNLYDFKVTLLDGNKNILHQKTQRFGFRFLDIASDNLCGKYIKLNDRRVFLISAISWGFYPQNGIYPTDEIAVRHVKKARELGLNMLNFHRSIGNTKVLNAADEVGLLLWEESGGYLSTRPRFREFFKQPYAYSLPSKRFLESVKLHRNHPSLVIHNMVNEPAINPDAQAKKDFVKAQEIDPTRIITYGSGFVNIGVKSPKKLHVRPYSDATEEGYCSRHNPSSSAGVYIDSIWNSPNSFLRNETSSDELLVFGEEGAIATPPQLELIVQEIKENPNGWDGADYKRRLSAYKNYISKKGLSKNFPSITKLITSLGNVMYYEHGRIIENARIADSEDIFVLNGWEDMKRDNFSGAVDAYRNLKGDPSLISRYTTSLFVAVKIRDKIATTNDIAIADFFVINENVLKSGEYKLRANLVNPKGESTLLFESPAKISGGKTFSDKICEGFKTPLISGEGYYQIKAELLDKSNNVLATGSDEIFVTNWKNDKISDKIAVAGDCEKFNFFANQFLGKNFLKLEKSTHKLEYIILGKISDPKKFETISGLNFTNKNGDVGLEIEMFTGKNFEKRIGKKVIFEGLRFNLFTNPLPDFGVIASENFSMRAKGFITFPQNTEVEFQVIHDDAVRIWVDDKLVIDSWKEGSVKSKNFTVKFEANKQQKIKIETFQAKGGWQFSLLWKNPSTPQVVDLDDILKRVKEDGTTLLILENARTWIKELHTRKAFPNYKIFTANQFWVGHNLFVKEHKYFKGLPTNCAMNWEYQSITTYGKNKHWGLYDIEGEEPIVSLVGYPLDGIATSVGIVRYGKGKILFSSLEIVENLVKTNPQSNIAKKIFTNILCKDN